MAGDCPELSLNEPNLDIDKIPVPCEYNLQPSQKNIPFATPDLEQKKGIGRSNNCDPMMTGQIVQDISQDPNRNVIYRYSKAQRGCDEAMRDLFSNIVVIDEFGVAHPVPIKNVNQERAVSAIIQDNLRKDGSAVVDRLTLPMMCIFASSFSPNWSRYTYHGVLDRGIRKREDRKPGFLWTKEKYERDTVFGVARGFPLDIGYTLTIWTYFVEDMNQILEQIYTKFSQLAYIRIQGVHWETIVRLDSISNNITTEPGNTANRIVKFEIGMTAETYIPQPIYRDKAVLKTRVEISDSVDENEIKKIIDRLEVAVEELR